MPSIVTKMVVGLGNPGKECADTRHNIGFRVIDQTAKELKIEIKRMRFGAVLGSGTFEDEKVILLKPWEFMNNSGTAVAKAAGFYKVEPCNLLVISDDMDLAAGRIRIRAKGAAGGHKGLADVIEKMGTDEFGRLRIGIGRNDNMDDVDFVLDAPSDEEQPAIDAAIARAREAVLCWMEYGIETAMNKFN